MPLERHRDMSAIDVLDRVLDKGIVVDYYARISVLGIDLLTTIDARVVVASVDTYFQNANADAITRILTERPSPFRDSAW
jgi:hypothetical protein